nr:USP6 N-terminal-like protein isoform X4 [Oryctolagus cuniculus]
MACDAGKVAPRLDMDTQRYRRALERAAIIMKYEQVPSWLQGCRGAALLEPEEEDDEGGCLVPDRLGFLHEQKLPQDSTPGAKCKQVRRIQKWVKMIKNHSKYHGSEKFQRRIYKGIPAQVHGKVWAVMLEVDKKKAQNPGKYEEMKEQARLGATHFHHIDSAITWTFRNHLMFWEHYGMKLHQLSKRHCGENEMKGIISRIFKEPFNSVTRKQWAPPSAPGTQAQTTLLI